MLTPVEGKTYITPHIHYAQIYALDGDIAGSTHHNNDKHGYVFQIHGKKLKDVQPDEDDVGHLIYKNTHPDWLKNLANKHLTPNVMNRVKDGEYAYFAKAGKKLLNKMSDEQKLDLINNHNTHIAHTGTLMPDKVFRIHHSKIPLLKRDGSNFFQHAEELNLHDLKNGIQNVK